MRNNIIKICILSLVFASISFFPFHRESKAQMVVTDPGNTAQGVLTAINTTASSISNYSVQYKETILDGLAYIVAKQVLHSLTASVVDWINNGFEGSPSFLTNPGGFFLDAADQLTGAFLSKNGELSQLCTPFSIDIRLSLALSQTVKARKRYTCTLGTIINNFKKLPENVSINGQNINNFMDGDFQEGGWPAFIALTTEPQNNAFGAYALAKADLDARITANKLSINADLNIGNGFMSWQKCDDLGTVDPNNDYEVNTAESIVGDDPRVVTRRNKDGTVTYRTCTTQTPGSVISGTLQKQLGAPVDQLNLADEINEIVSALFSQLIKKVLIGGLYGASQKGSGSDATKSVIEELTQPGDTKEFNAIKKQLVKDVSEWISKTAEYKTIWEEGLAFELDAKAYIDVARACFVTSGQHPDFIVRIDNIATSTLNVAYYASEMESANDTYSKLFEILRVANDPNSKVADIEKASRDYNSLITVDTLPTAINMKDAREAREEARKAYNQVSNKLGDMRSYCNFTKPVRTTTPD